MRARSITASATAGVLNLVVTAAATATARARAYTSPATATALGGVWYYWSMLGCKTSQALQKLPAIIKTDKNIIIKTLRDLRCWQQRSKGTQKVAS
jgi:hypothetical protein